MSCLAKIHGDSTICSTCNLVWDTNDANLPHCKLHTKSVNMKLLEIGLKNDEKSSPCSVLSFDDLNIRFSSNALEALQRALARDLCYPESTDCDIVRATADALVMLHTKMEKCKKENVLDTKSTKESAKLKYKVLMCIGTLFDKLETFSLDTIHQKYQSTYGSIAVSQIELILKELITEDVLNTRTLYVKV